jgi:hypothetical protein
MSEDTVINFTNVKNIKEFTMTANARIIDLEQCLYDILECSRLDRVKEMAADVLGEDLDSYFEEEREELDFEDDTKIGNFYLGDDH